jgi:uncharacterized protein (TIGR02466 family)
MIVHPIFPVLVCEFEYPNHEEFKQLFLNQGLKNFNEEGYSSEETAHVTLHHEEEYAELYKFASESTKQYLEALSVDSDVFNVNVVKSWLNVLENSPSPMHSHRDAHLSFTYYVNTPEKSNQPIRFYNYEPRMEPFPGCIRHNNTSNKWNAFNSYTWQFLPKQGNLFVFPSYIMHDTVCPNPKKEEGVTSVESLEKKRICIAGDVLLTYKDKTSKTLGLQPISNWKRF